MKISGKFIIALVIAALAYVMLKGKKSIGNILSPTTPGLVTPIGVNPGQGTPVSPAPGQSMPITPIPSTLPPTIGQSMPITPVQATLPPTAPGQSTPVIVAPTPVTLAPAIQTITPRPILTPFVDLLTYAPQTNPLYLTDTDTTPFNVDYIYPYSLDPEGSKRASIMVEPRGNSFLKMGDQVQILASKLYPGIYNIMSYAGTPGNDPDMLVHTYGLVINALFKGNETGVKIVKIKKEVVTTPVPTILNVPFVTPTATTDNLTPQVVIIADAGSKAVDKPALFSFFAPEYSALKLGIGDKVKFSGSVLYPGNYIITSMYNVGGTNFYSINTLFIGSDKYLPRVEKI